MCLGIPWTMSIYCDTPPPNIWMIVLQLKIEGLLFPHVSKWWSILSMFLDQTALSSIPLPIQPPMIRMGSFSSAIWILLSICDMFGALLQLVIKFFL